VTILLRASRCVTIHIILIYNTILKITFKYFISFVIDKITKDTGFWTNQFEPHASTFYMESLLPEIIDSKFDSG